MSGTGLSRHFRPEWVLERAPGEDGGVHRFERFSEHFGTSVISYGPAGGE